MNTAHDCIENAERLNAECRCVSLDQQRLAAELERVSPGFDARVRQGRPYLFADSMVYVGEAHLRRMAELARVISDVCADPAYQHDAMQWAPRIALHDPGTPGAFLGFDFHLGARGPQLIEINTNPGGALLNALLQSAQRACCNEPATTSPGLAPDGAQERFLGMFMHEWACWRARNPVRGARPSRLVIVDNDPTQQFLYPEFVLFQRLFEGAGIATSICGPEQLHFEQGALWMGQDRVDMVYNRLTDFSFEEPAHAALRAAYLADAALFTPHPRAHALYADKRNLAWLTDKQRLAQAQVPQSMRDVLLSSIPLTEVVDPKRADEFWRRRRALFFKPVAGFGSRAAYRGDKLTRRVFDEILAGDYVAQALVTPSVRTVTVADAPTELKLDLRCYVYQGVVQLTAARLWQGQTTNFRTPGGGFAAVQAVPCSENT